MDVGNAPNVMEGPATEVEKLPESERFVTDVEDVGNGVG